MSEGGRTAMNRAQAYRRWDNRLSFEGKRVVQWLLPTLRGPLCAFAVDGFDLICSIFRRDGGVNNRTKLRTVMGESDCALLVEELRGNQNLKRNEVFFGLILPEIGVATAS